MREAGIVGVHLRKKVTTTVPAPDAAQVPDLLQRDFTASEPNIKYVGDITYLPVGDGQFLYLATVLDLCSKRLVGWATADHMRTELVTDALVAAARTRGGDLVGAGWLGLGRQDEDEAADLVGGEAQGRDGAGGVSLVPRCGPRAVPPADGSAPRRGALLAQGRRVLEAGNAAAGWVRVIGRYEPWPGSRMHAPAALRVAGPLLRQIQAG